MLDYHLWPRPWRWLYYGQCLTTGYGLMFAVLHLIGYRGLR